MLRVPHNSKHQYNLWEVCDDHWVDKTQRREHPQAQIDVSIQEIRRAKQPDKASALMPSHECYFLFFRIEFY
jgi:hypothetical protein